MLRYAALLLVSLLGIYGAALAAQFTTLSPPYWVLTGTALDFNFATQNYWNSGANTTLTVTRATAETCTSIGGTLSYAAAGSPCITDAGLQVWQAATNLILQSQFSASWTATRSTITSNAVISPDVSVNAATLIEDATATSTHSINQVITKAASALPYTFSVYAKSSGRTRIYIVLDDGNNNGGGFVCDVAGQAVGVAPANLGTPFTAMTAGVDPVGSWSRCWFNVTSNTITNFRAIIYLDSGSATAALANSYSGNSTSGVQLFGAQLEQNSLLSPSPYIPTTTASATRNLDNISRAVVMGPVYTIFASGTPSTPTTTAQTAELVSINDASTNNFARLFRTTATAVIGAGVTSGGASQYSAAGSAWARNALGKAALAVSAGTQSSAFNGTALTGGTGALLPVAPVVLNFGERADAAASTQWNGTISRVAVFNSLHGSPVNITQ